MCYYHADALGSIIGLSDETGQEATRYAYDPFGNVTISGEISDNPFQFAGRENDGTGLLYERARYYSLDLMRYISLDPIGFAGGDVNLYVRVGNNPANEIDPLGLIRRHQGGVPIEKLFCPSNCSEQGREINSGIVASRIITSDPFGFAGTLMIFKAPYVPYGSGTRVKLQQLMQLTFVRLTCKCKDKCGRKFDITLVGNEESKWEIIHMWEQTVKWAFWILIYESEWRQRY